MFQSIRAANRGLSHRVLSANGKLDSLATSGVFLANFGCFRSSHLDHVSLPHPLNQSRVSFIKALSLQAAFSFPETGWRHRVPFPRDVQRPAGNQNVSECSVVKMSKKVIRYDCQVWVCN
ncbi:hypothetical protein TNCV_2444561 [Trichonephila clavipes]|nr:hypothetical protein TNCV_2444561 [Trichonephila clavipes]